MNQLKTQLQNGATAFGRARRHARNACIGAAVSLATVPAFAALDTTAVETAMTAAQNDAWSIANLAIPVIVVLAVAGIIYSLIRKV